MSDIFICLENRAQQYMLAIALGDKMNEISFPIKLKKQHENISNCYLLMFSFCCKVLTKGANTVYSCYLDFAYLE